ncbi:MAG: hypothetical protein ACOZNI_18495 [Myxococcota bacterium]
MLFKKIFEGRVFSASNGTAAQVKLPVTNGGRNCKVVQYMVKTVQTSGSAARITVELWHGPDGTTFVQLGTTPINTQDPGTSLPSVLAGDTGSSVVGEYLLPIVKVTDGVASNQQWAYIEVYEMRKPF